MMQRSFSGGLVEQGRKKVGKKAGQAKATASKKLDEKISDAVDHMIIIGKKSIEAAPANHPNLIKTIEVGTEISFGFAGVNISLGFDVDELMKTRINPEAEARLREEMGAVDEEEDMDLRGNHQGPSPSL